MSAGLGLLVITACVAAASAPFLAATPGELTWSLTIACLVLLAAAVGRWIVPWTRLPSWASLSSPTLGLAALFAIGTTAESVALAVVGLIPLYFLYVGAFHHARTGPLLLGPAGLVYLSMVGPVTATTLVRLVVYGAVWITTSGALSAIITRHRSANSILEHAATTDALTLLGNRLGLDARLGQALPGDCVVMCDLDLFKSINDAFGHAAGDEVLELFAATLGQHLRRRDYAARYGGEEFVLILTRTSPSQAEAALASLRAEWLDLAAGVTFSAGIAAVTPDRGPVAALAAADAAVYQAKASGRDAICVDVT